MTHTDSLDLDTALGPPKDVRLPGGTVRYRERGAGPTLLFVHGLLVNGALWRKVVPELARDFRCIAPDWPLGSHTVPLGDGADRTPGGMAKLIADFTFRPLEIYVVIAALYFVLCFPLSRVVPVIERRLQRMGTAQTRLSM